ncbi:MULTISPECIES: alpha/beta fold hydrolase [Caballeronia]|uniref:alpha/beta fold hydrolase n=1 Tax=Caballeronia TaxID=1827195 RepID=UPI001FD0308A|nr:MULTISPECIES: alpha/beta hydrolase [Caballeronia]MDR5799154.1 alpha/beta hydrolase [Caballeronia sp. LZ001]
MSIYPGVTEGTVNVDGFTVRFCDGGQVDSSAAPIVMVHGTGGRAETHFFTLFPMLASRHRVIGLDLSDEPGGRGSSRQLSVEALGAQVTGAIRHLVSDGKVNLIGYSLGAAVAVEATLQLKQQVSNLVLLNGWAKTDNALKLRLSLWKRLRDSEDRAALAEFMISSVYGRAFLNARGWKDIEQLRSDYVVGPGSDKQMALNLNLDIVDRLGLVKARTLVVGSTYDQLIPLEYSLELAGGIDNALLAEVKSGHGSVTERPAELFRIIDRFVRLNATSDSFPVFTDPSLKQLAGFQL